MYLNKKDLQKRWNKSGPTIGRYVREGILAQPVYIGQTAAWTEDQVCRAETKLITKQPKGQIELHQPGKPIAA